MKKAIAFAITLILGLSLAACGNNATDNNNSNNITSDGTSLQSDMGTISDTVSDMIAKISSDEAKKVALSHAGLKESDVTDIDVDLDRDNGVLKYEVNFHHGGTKYNYKINAENGDIISSNKDNS